MTKSVPKLQLSRSRDIPFCQLVLSQANVRRVKCGVSIPELADDIAARTLLQSLSVRAVLDDQAQETGMFEVPAGGRRFRALELLVATKRMAKDQPVPCVIREGGIAEEDSLAENVQRVALHPLDQFRAFKSLREAGVGEEEIAARFFVTPAVVRQRLRLASVSDKLLDLYAEDALTLDQLMAFTVSCDHGRQEQVWEAVSQGYNPQAYTIRRMLTEDSVRADDRRVRFVGRAAYEEAGGAVVRDLFQADDGGWLTDVPLLERLVGEKLNDEAVHVADEGWKWVEAALDLPYGHEFGMRRITGASPELGKKDQAKLDRLLAEFDRLSEEHEGADELPEVVDVRFGELETAIAALQNRPKVYDPTEMSRAGVFITVASDGRLSVERGFVRAEDEAPVEAGPDVQQQGGGTPVVTVDGKPVEQQDEEDDVIRPLPERLVAELTAERTLALRDALAQSPDAAFTALVHALVRSAFTPHHVGGCVEIAIKHAYLGGASPDLRNSPWAKSIAERHKAWEARLPTDPDALWPFLETMDASQRGELLAHCVSLSVNALFEATSRYNDGRVSAYTVERRMASAHHLAGVIGQDMATSGWTPTAANYLGRVTKPRILEAVREARGEEMVQLIAHLKKGDMATEAERLLEGSGWLPEPLRLPRVDEVEAAEAEQCDAPPADIVALPAFLIGDAGDDGASGDGVGASNEAFEPEAIAAE